MKKALALLLALCMLLTLCACADSGEKEFEAAKALYDAGDYENAIEALQSLNHYAEIADMIEDAQKQLAEESYGFLFTTWKDVNSDGTSTMIFHEDGTCDVDGSPTQLQYTVENNKITIAGIRALDITQEGGVYYLSEANACFVPEEDYDQFIAEHTVELTLDNFMDYYEWVETREEGKDAYGNVDSVNINHELKLKVRANLNLSEVEIGYTYEIRYFQGENLVIDFDTLEYSGASYSDTHTGSETVSLYQDYGWPVIYYIDSYRYSEGRGFVEIDSQPEIIRVEGHLVIW